MLGVRLLRRLDGVIWVESIVTDLGRRGRLGMGVVSVVGVREERTVRVLESFVAVALE